MSPAEPRLRAYHCYPVFEPTWGRTVFETSAGRARCSYWRDLKDAFDGIPFTAIRARVAGPVETPPAFLRTARYRGLDFARIGMRVRVDGAGEGLIVGANSSANFDVRFVAGPFRGQVLNCHPNHQAEYLVEGEWVKGDARR